jgi:phosphatidylglycerophosphatase A
MSRASLRDAWKRRPAATLVATGLGIGMAPVAPGTWASAASAALVWALVRGRGGSAAALAVAGAALATASAGILASGRVEDACGAKDPGQIVIDELAGQALAVVPCAALAASGPAWPWIVAFALFRVFDVWKPGPIRRLQALPGGVGVIVDDLAAGLAAGALTYGLMKIL